MNNPAVSATNDPPILGRRIAPPISRLTLSGVGRNNLVWLACLLLFVLSLYRYWPLYNPAATTPDRPETWRIANTLRDTGQFANPFAPLDTGLTAHSAPALPALLALLSGTFGVGGAGAFAYKLAVALAASIMLSLFPLVSGVLGLGAPTGFLAACLWLFATLQLHPGSDATHTAALVVIATYCFRRILQSGFSGKVTPLLGLVMGVMMLVSPACLPVLLCWLVWLAWKRKTAFFTPRAVMLLVVLPALIVSPWILRNYLVFHKIILVRDNFGGELSFSNNDCAAFSIVETKANGCFFKIHPTGNLSEARKVLAMGEARYYDLRLHEAILWIAGHPRKFASLSAERFVAFWLPHELGSPFQRQGGRERPLVYLLTALSVAGLWIAVRRDIDGAIICAIWLCVFPIPYYLVQFEARYRQPILWVTFLLGALPLAAIGQRLWNALVARATRENGVRRPVREPEMKNSPSGQIA